MKKIKKLADLHSCQLSNEERKMIAGGAGDDPMGPGYWVSCGPGYVPGGGNSGGGSSGNEECVDDGSGGDSGGSCDGAGSYCFPSDFSSSWFALGTSIANGW